MPEITQSKGVKDIEKLIIYECQNRFKMYNLLLPSSYLMSLEAINKVLLSSKHEELHL